MLNILDIGLDLNYIREVIANAKPKNANPVNPANKNIKTYYYKLHKKWSKKRKTK